MFVYHSHINFNNQHITIEIEILELRMHDRNMLTKPPNKKSLMIKPWKNIGKFDRISMYMGFYWFFSEEGAKKPKHASSEDDGHDDDENDY